MAKLYDMLPEVAAIAEWASNAGGMFADPRPDHLVNIPGANRWDQAPYYKFLYLYARGWEPKCVVELGTAAGCSALHMAEGFPGTFLVSVDIDHSRVRDDARTHPAIHLVAGSSLDVVDRVKAALPGPIDFLFVDSLHKFEHAKREVELYTPLCAKGALQAMDDIDCERNRSAEAWAAWAQRHFKETGQALGWHYAQRVAVNLNQCASCEEMAASMDAFWEWLPEPKAKVNELHPGTGFGLRRVVT